MEVKISQAIDLLQRYIRARLVPMLIGSPGCGKSQIVHQIAKEHDLEVIDLRLAQCDPCDLMGFPQIEGNRAGYAPMVTFPITSDPIPPKKKGWLLFLDEFNSASPAVQAAAYKLVLDRMVGQYKLHDHVAIVCAGNKETDNAIVQPLSTALQSRLTHLELVVDATEWVNWATANDIDYRITSFIKFKPDNLYTFRADHTDKTYAAPRTWEFTNRLLKGNDVYADYMLPLLAGTISDGVAREFITFCKIYKSLPKIEEITAKPETLDVPGEPSILFALTGALANHATKDNVDALMKYIKRLPVEFQVVCLRETVRRKQDLIASPAVQQWITSSAANLFS